MKYLVKQIFEEVSEEVDGRQVTTVTSNILGYEIKHKTTAIALPRGGNFIFVEGVDTEYPLLHTDEDGELSIIEDEKPKLVKQAYQAMTKDVFDEMERVFNTKSAESASAFASTYEAMLKRPANYIDVDLGLTTEEEVVVYATVKLNEADAYGVYRLKRINQYVAEQTAILTGE